jgi:hypothetical protein
MAACSGSDTIDLTQDSPKRSKTHPSRRQHAASPSPQKATASSSASMAAASPPRAAAGRTLSAVKDKENLDDAPFAQLLPTPVTIDKSQADASPGSSPAKKRTRVQGKLVFAPAAAARQGNIEKEPAAAVKRLSATMVCPLPGDAVAR